MPTIHELIREVPPAIYVAMVVIPLIMAAAAVYMGWEARRGGRERRASEPPPTVRSPREDALAAAITVAIVPFSFALLMLWARFG